MISLTDVVFVSLIAIGAAALIGVLGYLIEKGAAEEKR